MLEHFFMARVFLIGGALLTVIGVILWFALPTGATFPPFLVTALLAVGYGAFCFWQYRSGVRKP
jgi:uncharacterized membrane protein